MTKLVLAAARPASRVPPSASSTRDDTALREPRRRALLCEYPPVGSLRRQSLASRPRACQSKQDLRSIQLHRAGHPVDEAAFYALASSRELQVSADRTPRRP